MKKMTLSLDALRVESFETDADHPARGTVRGHDGSDVVIDGSNDISCDTCQTCDDSQCDSCWFNTCTCHRYCVGEA
ncbi:MAG TPA: pinensin family lanthipeptide [Longimicrobium sp.]